MVAAVAALVMCAIGEARPPVTVCVDRADGLPDVDHGPDAHDFTDAFVKISSNMGAHTCASRIVPNALSPAWPNGSACCRFSGTSDARSPVFWVELFDSDVFKSSPLAAITLGSGADVGSEAGAGARTLDMRAVGVSRWKWLALEPPLSPTVAGLSIAGGVGRGNLGRVRVCVRVGDVPPPCIAGSEETLGDSGPGAPLERAQSSDSYGGDASVWPWGEQPGAAGGDDAYADGAAGGWRAEGTGHAGTTTGHAGGQVASPAPSPALAALELAVSTSSNDGPASLVLPLTRATSSAQPGTAPLTAGAAGTGTAEGDGSASLGDANDGDGFTPGAHVYTADLRAACTRLGDVVFGVEVAIGLFHEWNQKVVQLQHAAAAVPPQAVEFCFFGRCRCL